MRPQVEASEKLEQPQLLGKAIELDGYLKTLSVGQLSKVMSISRVLAEKTHKLIALWSASPDAQRLAIDSFLGDIYSGLQVGGWSPQDREYANETLRILSGLYGIIRPLDGICPYRLEMGYRLPESPCPNLYNFWAADIAGTLPKDDIIINLAAVEYSKAVTPYLDPKRIVTPTFLTVSPKTNEPAFVVVHAKIARGAFARWLVINRVKELARLPEFNDLGYVYSNKLSSELLPVFVCKKFGGIGLSVRLK